jgi:hypothetical protein
MATEGKIILMALVCCLVILLAGCKIKDFNPYTTLMQEIITHDKTNGRTSTENSR